MNFSNSQLVAYTKLSPNCTKPRNQSIKKITIHHTAGVLSIEAMGDWLAKPTTKASSNYGIGGDGRVAMYVEEKNRAWTSSSSSNDNQAVTYEVCNSTTAPDWKVSDKALETVIALSVDVCLRNPDIRQTNGERGLTWTGDAKGSLTIHKFFASTNCPGPYLEPKMPWIAKEVNRRLEAALAENQNGTDTGKDDYEVPEYLDRKYKYCDGNIPLGLEGELKEAIDLNIVTYGADGFNPLLSEQDIRTIVWIKRSVSR